MGYSFATIEPNQLGQVTKFDIPLNDWLGIKFSEGYSYTFGNASSEFTEDRIWDDENPVSPAILNRVYGIDSRLKFDTPMSIQRARLIHERKRKELERLSYLESASHSAFSVKAAAGFGASLVGSLSHPVDLGLAFLPFIGSEKAAAQVAKLGGGNFRQALARGLITTEESLAARGVPFARLTAGVIDGTLSQAMLEIPVAIQKYRNQADYTLTDSVFNVAAGGAFSGAIKGLGLALERAGKLWLEADPRIRDAALMDAVNTILTGEQPKTHWAMGLDEATIRAKTEERIRGEQPFVEPEARLTETETARLENEGFAAANTPEGRTTYKPAIKFSDGTIATGPSHDAIPGGKGIRGYVDPEGNFLSLMDVARRESEIQAATNETRRQSIADFNAKAKADYEAKIKDQVDTETRRVMDEVRKQSPALDPEVAKKNTFKPVPDDASINALNEEIADLEASIFATAKTPEERLRLEERLKRTLAEADELSGEKAVDKMLPCVTKRAE